MRDYSTPCRIERWVSAVTRSALDCHNDNVLLANLPLAAAGWS
jgi:hypothetical protein